MKKFYTLAFAALLTAGTSFAQTFTYTNIDAVKSGNPGDELIFAGTIVNTSSTTNIPMRVTRQQNVDVDAPTWTSAFCMDVCYLPTTDSVNFTLMADSIVNFTFHMYTDGVTPGHARGQMRWKNTNNGANVYNQAFIGVTDGTSGMSDLSGNTANVSIYPMPVSSNDIFTVGVSNVKTSGAISMVIYNTLGSVVSTRNVIAGINIMDVNLPCGVYSYSLITGDHVINSGKMVVTE